MKASEIHPGEFYWYRASSYEPGCKCKVLDAPVSGNVRIEVYTRNYRTSLQSVPTRRLRCTWKHMENAAPDSVAKYEETRQKAKEKIEMREREQHILVQRVQRLQDSVPFESDFIKDLDGVIQSGQPYIRTDLDRVEQFIKLALGIEPIPSDGVKCNQCEQNPAMANDYLCHQCRYGS